MTASADGVIEPIRKVEVKSKASGEITQMTVDTGDAVEQGQILLQLLPRDAQNSYDQATADLDAAEARLGNAKVELSRSQSLFDDGLVSRSQLDTSQLAVTTAKTDVVRATKARDTAAERLSETTVRSPISGIVIAKSVEVGQVVSSAVSQVSGGTLLLTLADLAEVQVRSLVDEVDIGKIRAGQAVSIKVEAFPEHDFYGEVLKVEPQAVVDQNVTLFPVLTRIQNREGLLKPGMNAEIEVLIAKRDDALFVANEALKTPDEATKLASFIDVGGGKTDGAGKASGPNAAGPPRQPAPTGAPAGDAPAERPDAKRVLFIALPTGGYQQVPITIGLKTWEVTEITGGATEGMEVVLLPNTAQLRQSAEFRQRMQRMGGMPGMNNRSSGTARRSGS